MKNSHILSLPLNTNADNTYIETTDVQSTFNLLPIFRYRMRYAYFCTIFLHFSMSFRPILIHDVYSARCQDESFVFSFNSTCNEWHYSKVMKYHNFLQALYVCTAAILKYSISYRMISKKHQWLKCRLNIFRLIFMISTIGNDCYH